MAEDQVDRLNRLRRTYQERINSHDADHPGYAEAWASFQNRLLQFGGTIAVPPGSPDPMIDMFKAKGAAVSPKAIVTVDGTRSDCHQNAVALWRSGAIVAIGTGYGLNGDLWREHSWGWDAEDRVIETTQTREVYFGLRMEGEPAEWFAGWIDPTDS